MAGFLLLTQLGGSTTIYVGPQENHRSIQSAAAVAQPGDTILVRTGTYSQRENIVELKGDPFQSVYLLAERRGQVIFQGGTEAWHLSDCEYLVIDGFVFHGQTGNGVNIDDAGTYNTPTHHIHLRHCIFRDMDASGNNDLLKLSGLDDFKIEFCQFLNGSSGGSGIDMVGCHNGAIRANEFENMGSNAIQAKGGTQYIRIYQNSFVNAGFRAVNLGGSTGLAFFRPQDAPFEAADLMVRANTFVGSDAPIAYVGSTRVTVENNTIYLPGVWVYRILQENVDPSRFIECGDNIFRNNLVIADSRLRRDFNIGPNTRPETFIFENNLWYNLDDPNWDPANPGMERSEITGVNPEVRDAPNGDFQLEPGSAAIGAGRDHNLSYFDRRGKRFNTPPSIGAFEGGEKGISPFAPLGAEWYYDGTWDSRPYTRYYRMNVAGDTIIANKTLQIMHYFSGNAAGETRQESADLMLTTEDGTVEFFINGDFWPLYDFSNDGERMVSFGIPNEGHIYHVEEWETYSQVGVSYLNSFGNPMDINGLLLSVVTPEDLLGQDGLCVNFGDTIIERIGGTDRGLLPFPCPSLRGGHYGRLRCYSDHEVTYRPRRAACDSTEVTTQTDLFEETETRIYPNPMSDDFILEVNMNGDILISNLSGKEMFETAVQPGKNRITVSHLPFGVYNLKFDSGTEVIHSRIVISN